MGFFDHVDNEKTKRAVRKRQEEAEVVEKQKAPYEREHQIFVNEDLPRIRRDFVEKAQQLLPPLRVPLPKSHSLFRRSDTVDVWLFDGRTPPVETHEIDWRYYIDANGTIYKTKGYPLDNEHLLLVECGRNFRIPEEDEEYKGEVQSSREDMIRTVVQGLTAYLK
jgi:hypothetical protein